MSRTDCYSNGLSDPYCVILVDNEYVARYVNQDRSVASLSTTQHINSVEGAEPFLWRGVRARHGQQLLATQCRYGTCASLDLLSSVVHVLDVACPAVVCALPSDMPQLSLTKIA